jgi:hypothetical protein
LPGIRPYGMLVALNLNHNPNLNRPRLWICPVLKSVRSLNGSITITKAASRINILQTYFLIEYAFVPSIWCGGEYNS